MTRSTGSGALLLSPLVLLIIGGVLLLTPSGAKAGEEEVYVNKVIAEEDACVIARRNGETYLVHKGAGCWSLYRFENKTILVVSSDKFADAGSTLSLPDTGQTCKITSATQIQ